MKNFISTKDIQSHFILQRKTEENYSELFNCSFSYLINDFKNDLDKEQQYYAEQKIIEYNSKICSLISRLKRDLKTRQAILRFDVSSDLPNCLIDIQFQIRDEVLIVTAFQRSLDLLGKLNQDIEIVNLISKSFCNSLFLHYNKTIVTFFVGNLHYYKVDADLFLLNDKIVNCKNCNLCKLDVNKQDYNKGLGKLVGLKSNDTKKVDYLFVGINPSIIREEKLMKIFDVSESHKNTGFTDILKELHIYNQSYISNIVKCSGSNNDQPSQNIVDECINHLLKEIEILKPKKIIALGNFVYRHLINRVKNIDIYKIYHPSYCFSYNNISYDKYKDLIQDTVIYSKAI